VKDVLLLVLVGVILWVTVIALRAVYVVRVVDRGGSR
jgi:hypothetical protein